MSPAPDNQQRKRLLAEFVTESAAAVALFDQSMCYLATSERWRHDYGLAADPVGRSHYDIFPEISGTWKAVHQRALLGEVVRGDEDRFERHDGRIQWLNWEAQPWYDDDGEIGGISIHSEEITRPKAAQQALADNLARYRALLDTAVAAIVTIDSHGTIDSINPATTQMFGFAADELIGRNVRILMPEPYAGQHDGYIANYLTSGARKIIGIGREVTARRKDGSTFPMHLAVSEFVANGQRRFAGVITDRSERRAAQDALEEAQRRLVHAQKMEAIGQLAGGIAHDFNNLLTVILGNLELIEQRLPDSDLRDLLRRVQEAAASGSDLTQRLLGFSRQLPLDPRQVTLNDLVLRTTELLRRTLGESVNLSTTLASDLWDVRADPSQVESALTNLAINARDAMPDGGRILVETRNAHVDAEQIATGLELEPGDYVIMSVSDSGSGIAPEIRARVFEPFFTTKTKGRGTGLGLAMIYGFAKQSGGHVSVYSEVGHGTTFRLYLPRASGKVALAAHVAGAEPDAVAATARLVLLVEDDAGLRRLNVERLQHLGYEVVEASSGAEALELIRKGLRPDLIFTDMIMPGGVSGRELLERAIQIAPATRFLLTSGYSEEMVSPEGRPLAAKLLQKPYRMADLAKALKTAFAHSPGC